MAKAKKIAALTLEERLEQALVPEEAQPYPVPENWCWTKLGEICCFINGYAFKSSDYCKSGTPLLRISNIQDNTIDFSDCIYIQKSANNCFLVQRGDLLIALSGATTGKNGVYMFEYPAFLNQRVGNLKVISEKVLLPLFRNYYIQEKADEILKSAYGGAQPNISSKDINTFSFPLPPLTEQQRIIDRIESLFAKLDEAKEKAQASLDSFETRKAAILHKAFTGELTAKWRKENGEDFITWLKVSLQDLCEKITCGKTPTEDISIKGEIPFLKVYNIVDNKIDFEYRPQFISKQISESKLKSSILYPDDVIMNIVGPPLRKIAIVPNTYKQWNINQAIVRFRPKEKLLSKYLYFALINPKTLEDVISDTKGVVGQANISVSQSRNLAIPLPPIPEQTEIVRLLDDFFSKEQKAKELCSVLDNIDLIKKSILARAFRGELGTNDPSEESAMDLLKSII